MKNKTKMQFEDYARRKKINVSLLTEEEVHLICSKVGCELPKNFSDLGLKKPVHETSFKTIRIEAVEKLQPSESIDMNLMRSHPIDSLVVNQDLPNYLENDTNINNGLQVELDYQSEQLTEEIKEENLELVTEESHEENKSSILKKRRRSQI
jgi:hypothetical protein